MKKIFLGIFLSLILSNYIAADEVATIKVDVLAQSGSSWDGEPLPNYPKGKPKITILKILIPPKTQLPLHKHPVINAGVLLKGELTVVKENGELLHLKAGDSIIELVNKGHYGKNEGNGVAEIIVFYAGTEDTPITIKTNSNPN